MSYELSPLVILFASISILALFLIVYPLIYRPKSSLTYHFVLLVASTAIWSIGYTLEIFTIDFNIKLIWLKFEYLGITTLSPLFLLFVLVFTNRSELASKPIIRFIFFPSFLHYIFMITNEYHNLWYSNIELNITNSFRYLSFTYGPIFYSNSFYSYLLLLIGLILLSKDYLKPSQLNPLHHKQLEVIILGTLFPLGANIVYNFNLIVPIRFIDLTIIFFVISYIFYAWALFEMGFLDIVPIARQQIFMEILDGLIVLNKDWKIIDLNDSAYDLLKTYFQTSEILGANIFILLEKFIKDPKYASQVSEIRYGFEKINNNSSDIFSIDLNTDISTSGSTKRSYYNLLASAIKRDKTVIGYLIILRNISDRIEAENFLEQKNQMQESILKILSHDLRNHLNVLKGYLELIKTPSSTDEIDESLKVIELKNDAALKIIEEVSAYLKVETMLKSHQLEIYNLVDVIKETVFNLKPEFEKNDIKLTLDLGSSPAYILANLVINSVFLNLIQNAIKFSPKGGEIMISLNLLNDRIWRIKISDEGPGVLDDLKIKIFEPFHAFGNKKGLGLGLSIAKDSIGYFLGDIRVEDNNPTGAIFIVDLPKTKDFS